MITYKYEAVSFSGVTVTGVIEAKDQSDAVAQLKETCSVVNSLTPVTEFHLLDKLSLGMKINEKHLALVCEQFAIILTTGLPIVQTIELVADQTEDKTLKNVLKGVGEDVAAGMSMADSFTKRGNSLPVTFIETIRAGEESGHLEEAFRRLAEFFSKKAASRAKVISALTYPAFVMVVAIAVIFIIMIYAVPVFSQTFLDLGIELPWATRFLIAASNFMTKYIFVILGVIAAIVVLIRLYAMTEAGGIRLAKLLTRIPILGKLQMMSGAAQFAHTLSTMLAAGLPIVRALEITAKAMTNKYLGASVANVLEPVASGTRVGVALRKEAVLPKLLIEMTAVGEESGSVEETLTVVGKYYDNEVDVASERAVSLLEPIIICFLAVFVVFVLLAVYLPMFSMYGNMGM